MPVIFLRVPYLKLKFYISINVHLCTACQEINDTEIKYVACVEFHGRPPECDLKSSEVLTRPYCTIVIHGLDSCFVCHYLRPQD